MAQPPANFITLLNQFAQKAAVADAEHDFSGDRAGSSLFKNIYVDSKFTKIGTPGDSNSVDIESEFDILAQFKPFDTPSSSNFYSKPNSSNFQKILNEAPASGKIGTFIRFQGDDEYEVTATLVATKPDGNYDWKKTPEEVYNLFNPESFRDSTGEPAIAFTIDACSVKFYEHMFGDSGSPGQPTLKAYYILPREGINDAAGKVNIKPHANSKVGIEIKEDTAPYNVLYPITDLTRENLAELECFFSIFNLSLTSVNTVNNGVPSTTLNITDKGFTRQVQVLKHSTEDSHPNAVPTLSAYIESLMSSLTFASDKYNDKMSYYAALQQKRSGDWLQVLACLQPERFGLDKNMRPIIVTVDKICLAYALFAGVDACFTYWQKEGNKYWLVHFHKKMSGAGAISKETKLQNLITNFPKRESLKPTGDPTEDNYENYKTVYATEYTKIDTQLKSALDTVLTTELPSRGRVESKLEDKVKEVLYAAATLCVFRSIVPKLKTEDDGGGVFPDVSEENYDEVYSKFTNYRHNYMSLKEAINATFGKYEATTGSIAINKYFGKLNIKNSLNTVAYKKRKNLIDKLKIFGGLFSSPSGQINGVGIFSFLNQQLNPDEQSTLIERFKEYSANITVVANKANYDKFTQTMDYLSLSSRQGTVNISNNRIPFQQGGAHEVPEFLNSQLIKVIHDSMYILPNGNNVTEAVVKPIRDTKIIADSRERSTIKAPAAVSYGPKLRAQLRVAEAKVEALTAAEEAVSTAGDAKAARTARLELRSAQKAVTELLSLQAADDITKLDEVEVELEDIQDLEESPDDSNVQVNDSIQVGDYGPALAILRGKGEDPEIMRLLVELKTHISALQSTHGGGGTPIKSTTYYHNPLTTFYFLFRDLGWRLTLEDIGEHGDCVRLSQLLEYTLFEYPDKQDYNLIEKYLYWGDLERYFLYFDSTQRYSKCEIYFIRDIMLKVRDTYLNRPESAEEKYYQIQSIPDVFSEFEASSVVEPSEQVTKNLELMRGLIEKIKEIEVEFGKLGAIAQAASQPVPKAIHNNKTRNRRVAALGFNTYRANRASVPVVEAHGGSRRKHRQKKGKTNKRKTKKRKNFVV